MKFDLTYWHVKDIVALLVLSKLYGASNLSILKNLNFPRLRKYTIKEIREKFSILQKKQIILRNSRDKSKFYINHDTGLGFLIVHNSIMGLNFEITKS